jgi:hypothetical protein
MSRALLPNCRRIQLPPISHTRFVPLAAISGGGTRWRIRGYWCQNAGIAQLTIRSKSRQCGDAQMRCAVTTVKVRLDQMWAPWVTIISWSNRSIQCPSLHRLVVMLGDDYSSLPTQPPTRTRALVRMEPRAHTRLPACATNQARTRSCPHCEK